MSNMKTYQVEISKNYTIKQWHEDVKYILYKVTESNDHFVFLLCDSLIKNQSFLDDINQLLNNGEIPNLFQDNEKLEICNKMRIIDWYV